MRRESPADTPNPAPDPDPRPRPPRRRYLRPRRWPGLCGRRARSRRVLHKDRQPQTHSGRTEREGEEGGRDGGMRRLFCWCPRPRALPRGERVWGRGQHGGYIKKKLQKKRKTEKKRNRRSELERRRERGGETKKTGRSTTARQCHEGKSAPGRGCARAPHTSPRHREPAHDHHKRPKTNTNRGRQLNGCWDTPRIRAPARPRQNRVTKGTRRPRRWGKAVFPLPPPERRRRSGGQPRARGSSGSVYTVIVRSLEDSDIRSSDSIHQVGTESWHERRTEVTQAPLQARGSVRRRGNRGLQLGLKATRR